MLDSLTFAMWREAILSIARARSGSFPGHLIKAYELSFAIEEFVAAFSCRGWIARMHQAADLEATFRHLLAEIDLIRPPGGRKLEQKLVRSPRITHESALRWNTWVNPDMPQVDAAANEILSASSLMVEFGGIKGLTSPTGALGSSSGAAERQQFIDRLQPLLHVPPGMTLDEILIEVGI